jgi:Tol biopolymer transport system component
MPAITHRIALSLWLAAPAAAGDVLAPSELASHTPAGLAGTGPSTDPAISADGRYVAFWSQASDLVPNDTNGNYDVFVYDSQTGAVELISVGTGGVSGNGPSIMPAISGDGRYVCFESGTTNLVSPPSSGIFQIFVRDRLAGTTQIASIDSGGAEANNTTEFCDISADGRFVSFASYADNLVLGDAFNGMRDIFVRDRLLGTTIRISTGPGGVDGNSTCAKSTISGDGSYVAFESSSSNLVPGGTTSARQHIYLYDRLAASLTLASADVGGTEGNDDSFEPCLSDGGAFLAFATEATNLLPPPDVSGTDIALRQVVGGGAMERLNLDTVGDPTGTSNYPSLSADGRFAAFYAPNAVPVHTGHLVVRDRALAKTIAVCSEDDGGLPGPGHEAVISADGTTVAMTVSGELVAEDQNGATDIYVRGIGAPARYGFPKMNSLGCLPTIEFSGEARVSNGYALSVSSSSVRNNKTGLLIHGVSGAQAKAFGGGLLYVVQGKRSSLVSSGGTPPPVNDCSGAWTLDLGTMLASSPIGPGVGAGSVLYLQWWGRDTPNTVQLSDALQVVVAP